MRLVVLSALLLACGRGGPTSEPIGERAAPDSISSPVVEAPAEARPTTDAGAEAAPLDPPVGALVETAGTGTCKVDADCELSSYQAGCCVQGCQPYARNRRALEKAIAAEAPACEAFRRSGEPCPPPAPCPRPTHEPIAAKCVERRCYTVLRELVGVRSRPPGPSP